MIVNRKEFIEALSVVDTAVSGISSVPLFTRVLLSYAPRGGDPGVLTLRGTDASLYLEGRVAIPEVSGDDAFAVAVPPDRLLAVLNTMRGEQVEIATCPGKSEGRVDLRLQAGKTDTVIAGLDGSDYPELPELSPLRAWTAPAALLADGIRRVAHAAVNPQKAQVKGIMNAVAFFPEVEDEPEDPEHPSDQLVVFASDTHRAAQAFVPMSAFTVYEDNFNNADEQAGMLPDALVPLPEAQVIARLLSAAREGEEARLAQSGGGLTVETTRYRGVFSLVEGTWQKGRAWAAGLVGDAATFEGYCDREQLLASVKGARACIPKDGANEWQDDLVALISHNPMTGPELHVRTGDRDGAKFADTLEITLHSGELFACPTGHFLSDALPSLSAPTVGIRVGERFPSLILTDYADPPSEEKAGENRKNGKGPALRVELFIQPRSMGESALASAIRAEWEQVKAGE